MLDAAAGIVPAIPSELDVVELNAVAVDPRRHNQEIGKTTLALMLTDLANRGRVRAVFGTGNSSIGQIALYQKVGFRMWKIEHDRFSP